MKQYSIHHVPLWSFFSRRLYRDVCFEWRGVAFGYLLVLLAVCWVAPMLKLHMQFGEFVDNDAPPFLSQVPVITITDGRASIAEPQPYEIVDPDSGRPLVVIDTTGQVTSFKDTEAVALLSATQVMVKNSDIETRTFDLEEIDDITLRPDNIQGWLNTGRRFLAPLIYALGVPGSFVVRIIQALIYAAVGLLFARACRCRRSYAQLLRLSVVAMTPMIIIKTATHVAGWGLPGGGWVTFFVTQAFLFYGIKATTVPAEGEE